MTSSVFEDRRQNRVTFRRRPPLEHSLIAFFCVVALAGSCVGELTIPADAQLTCTTTADCPVDLVCNVDAALCIAPGTVLDLAAPIVVSTAVDVARIGVDDTAIVTIIANETIQTATVVDSDGRSLTVTIVGDVVTAAVVGAGRDRSGAVTISLDWADAAGNSAVATLTSGVVIDIDPPLVQADTVVVVANGNANVLSPAAPAAARADSGAVVVFGFDEVVVAATAPRLVPFSSPDAAGVDIFDVVTTIDAAGTGVALSIAPGGLAFVSEGAWLVALNVVDELGNAGRVVGTSLLIIDTTPPPAPTFSLVRRAPFGDGARVAASNALAGTALDAVLVVAVPNSVVVDNTSAPPFVGRREPDALGAFAIEVPVDIEALRVVAVDEAGNLSLPAAPQVIELVASILARSTPHRVFARQSSEDVLLQRADSAIGDRLRTGSVTTTAAPVWTPLTTVAHDGIGSAPAFASDPVSGGTIAVIRGESFSLRGNQFTRLDLPRLPVENGYSMATDLRRGVVVLFGGDGADDTARNSLWEFNGEAWTERLVNNPDATDRPSPRVGAGVVYSAALGGVAFVNGCRRDFSGFLGRTCAIETAPAVWLWNGATFTNLCTGAACGDAPRPNRPEVTVDASGALIATGGFDNPLDEAIEQVLPPQVFTFDGARWVGRCAQACAAALPVNAAAYFDAGSGLPAFLGSCGGALCTARLADDDTIAVTILQGATPAISIGGRTFDQRPVFVEPDGRLIVAMFGTFENALGFVAAVEGNRVGVVVPGRLTPRCGGAVVDLEGDAAVVGGCGSCGLDESAGAASACVAPSGIVEVPGHAGLARGTIAAAGLMRRVDALAGPRLVHSSVDPQTRTGTARFFNALDLTAAPVVVDLGAERSVEGVFPLSDGRIALLESTFADFSSALIDTVRAVDGTSLQTVCAGSCGGVGGGIFGLAVAGDVAAGSAVFGGNTGGGVGDGTVRFSSAGLVVGGTVSPSPPARRFGSAAFDEATAATWLFGGMSQPRNRTGDDIFDCGVAGGTAECGDLWRLDGDRWQQVDTVDVAGFGRPAERYSAAFGAVGGRLIIAGGEGRVQTRDDAWSLDASPARVPSHLFELALTPYGADAAGTVSAVEIEWCGEAYDALGLSTAMQARLWIGGGWRAAPLVVTDGCARGHLDVSDVADVVIRNHRLVVEVRATAVSASGSAVPTLTTTQLTVTAIFLP